MEENSLEMKDSNECLLVDKDMVRRLKEEAKENLSSNSPSARITGVDIIRVLDRLGLLCK